jgi:hypothetical protein
MATDTTDTAWAVTWIAASGGQQLADGQQVRSYGKDEGGRLVAVRTDAGDFPVNNLSAVLAHRRDR